MAKYRMKRVHKALIPSNSGFQAIDRLTLADNQSSQSQFSRLDIKWMRGLLC